LMRVSGEWLLIRISANKRLILPLRFLFNYLQLQPTKRDRVQSDLLNRGRRLPDLKKSRQRTSGYSEQICGLHKCLAEDF
jgi:hypothetical protein